MLNALAPWASYKIVQIARSNRSFLEGTEMSAADFLGAIDEGHSERLPCGMDSLLCSCRGECLPQAEGATRVARLGRQFLHSQILILINRHPGRYSWV